MSNEIWSLTGVTEGGSDGGEEEVEIDLGQVNEIESDVQCGDIGLVHVMKCCYLEERLDIEVRQVLGIVVGVLTLEVTAGVDGLEEGPSVRVLAVRRAAEFPPITVDDDTGVTGDRIASSEGEWLEDLHVFNDESIILKDGLSASASEG